MLIEHPKLRPFADFFYIPLFGNKSTFSGWGLNTIHQVPWDKKYENNFLETHNHVKSFFDFAPSITNLKPELMEKHMWRHWIVVYAIRHAIKSTKIKQKMFVECGVSIGLTAFFALREISFHNIENFYFHLYDSWEPMKKEFLLESELSSVGKYDNMTIEITKQNLHDFKENTVYHQGYIPNSFNVMPESPEHIVYLHIDLNAAKPTISTLEYFLPRLEPGGVILFDDYGWMPYFDTKNVVDEFFHDKPGTLLKLPTGQAIYFHN